MEVEVLPAVHWNLLVFVCSVLVRLSAAQSGSELVSQVQSPYIIFGSSSVGKFVLNGSDVTDPNGEKLITSCGSTVNVVNYYYEMDKLFWVAGNKIFMSNLSDITNRDCSAQTIIAEESRRPVALAVDWIHDILFWILEDDHTFDVEQIVQYDLTTMDEARVVTNLSVTTVQWLAVYPFPDNGSSVLMWIEQVDRTKGYDIIFISSDTESKERLSVPQLANCRILSQYLNVPDGALYLLASCTYTTILYSFDLAVRHLNPICYLRTTLGIAIFRDVLYTYSPLQLFSSRLEGASPEHDIYLKEIGHQRQSGDRYRHITVVDQSLQPEVNEIPPWQPFVNSNISTSLQLSTAIASISTYTASILTTSSRLSLRTTPLITSSVEYTPMQHTSTKAPATPYATPSPSLSSMYSSVVSLRSVPLSLSMSSPLRVHSSVLSISSFSVYSSVASSSSALAPSSLSVYTSVVHSSSIPAPSSLVRVTTSLLQSLPQSTEVLLTSTVSVSTLPSSTLFTSSPTHTSPPPSISGTPSPGLPQPQISTTSLPPQRDTTISSSSTILISVSSSMTSISEELKSDDLLVIVVPVAAASAVLLMIIIGAVMLCIICWCRRRKSDSKKKNPPKFYLYYSEPVARDTLQ